MTLPAAVFWSLDDAARAGMPKTAEAKRDKHVERKRTVIAALLDIKWMVMRQLDSACDRKAKSNSKDYD